MKGSKEKEVLLQIVAELLAEIESGRNVSTHYLLSIRGRIANITGERAPDRMIEMANEATSTAKWICRKNPLGGYWIEEYHKGGWIVRGFVQDGPKGRFAHSVERISGPGLSANDLRSIAEAMENAV